MMNETVQDVEFNFKISTYSNQIIIKDRGSANETKK